MRNIILSLFLLAPAFLVSSCVHSPVNDSQQSVAIRDVPPRIQGADLTGPRQRMFVLPVQDKSHIKDPHLAQAAQSFLMDQLSQSGQVVLVQASELKLDLEKHRGAFGYDFSSLSEKAQAAGVTVLLEPIIEDVSIHHKADNVGLVRNSVSDIDARLKFRLVSTKHGRTLFDESRSSTTTDSQYRIGRSGAQRSYNPTPVTYLMENIIFEAIPELLSAIQGLSWEGRIAMVKGERVYLNVGRLSGLQLGDILRVTEEGQDVFDPETGVKIGQVTGRMKGTVEVVGYFGNDGAVASIHSGSGFQENDRIELY